MHARTQVHTYATTHTRTNTFSNTPKHKQIQTNTQTLSLSLSCFHVAADENTHIHAPTHAQQARTHTQACRAVRVTTFEYSELYSYSLHFLCDLKMQISQVWLGGKK